MSQHGRFEQDYLRMKEKYFEDAIKVIYDAFITNAAPAK